MKQRIYVSNDSESNWPVDRSNDWWTMEEKSMARDRGGKKTAPTLGAIGRRSLAISGNGVLSDAAQWEELVGRGF